MHAAFSNFRFMLLWIGAYCFALFASLISFVGLFLGGSFIVMLIVQANPEVLTPQFALVFSLLLYSLMGLVFGLLFGTVQKGLLRQQTDEPWRGWLISSMIGGVLAVDVTLFILAGQIAPYLQWLVMPPPEILLWIGLQVATIPFGILAFAQSFVLWGYVHSAWLWVLANLVGGLVVYGLLAAGVTTWVVGGLGMILLVLGLSAAPALVTGFAMVWLLNMNWKH